MSVVGNTFCCRSGILLSTPTQLIQSIDQYHPQRNLNLSSGISTTSAAAAATATTTIPTYHLPYVPHVHHNYNHHHHSTQSISSTAQLTSVTSSSSSSQYSEHQKTTDNDGVKLKRNASEVNWCLKYIIFAYNLIFWLCGLIILIVGLWAWTEKDYFNNLSRVTNITMDPVFLLVLFGSIAFTIGFTGCLGALRENTTLLAAYAILLVILLIFELTIGILGFIFRDWIKSQAANGFKAFIVYYRDDPDRQNLVDWIQGQWLECCGIEGPKDWNLNIYFNCSSSTVGSREACGVPFSCCKPIPNELIPNKQCGYDVRNPGYANDKSTVIYEKGCLRAGEEWMEENFLPVVGVSVAIAILQILGICLAQNLRADVYAQKSKWR